MKTFRVKVWTYNSKHQELSKTFRCALPESMDCSDIISVLDNLTHYKVAIFAGLGKHAKRKGILDFVQTCLAVSKVKFTEVVECNDITYKTERKLKFKLYLPCKIGIITGLANKEWMGYDYTFFEVYPFNSCNSVVKFDKKNFETMFEKNGLPLHVAVNGFYYVKDSIDIVRDKEDADYYDVYILDEVIASFGTGYKTVVL